MFACFVHFAPGSEKLYVAVVNVIVIVSASIDFYSLLVVEKNTL